MINVEAENKFKGISDLVDQNIVEQLIELGFEKNSCERAV